MNSINYDSIKYIFVDFDDTIVYTSYANFLSYKNAIWKISGIDIVYVNERCSNIILSEIEQNKTKLQEIIKLKNKYYENYLQYTFVNNNLISKLESLQSKKIFLVTYGKKYRVEATLKYHNIYNLFHDKYYSTYNDKWTSKYLNLFNEIVLTYPDITINDILIFENSDLEIIKAINCGFKLDKIIQIPIKIYSRRIV